MPRYIEVTHIYELEVPAEDVEIIEPLAREGMSIMEGWMQARAANIRNIRSDWKMMPKDYVPRITDTPPIIVQEDEGVRLIDVLHPITEEEMSKLHPWEQGVRFFPEDHPLYEAENEAIRQEKQEAENDEGRRAGDGIGGSESPRALERGTDEPASDDS